MIARITMPLLVALLLAGDAPNDEAVQQEMKKLQGTWKVISFEAGGTDQTAKGPKEIVIKGDELEGLAPNVKFRVDPAKKPKTLDLIDKGDAKKIFPLIYELKGDELKIVIPLVPAGKGEAPKRPDSFETKDKPLALIKAKRAGSEKIDVPVIVVAATYPGANAQVVADTVAAPIEQQVNGVEGMVRIESTSNNNGNYTAHIRFKPNAELKSAMKLVENRVGLADPVLPDEVRRNKVTVKIGKAEIGTERVAIVVIDRADHGWTELQKTADGVVKRLAAADALLKPQLSPRDEKQMNVEVSEETCKLLGVTKAEVYKALLEASQKLNVTIGSVPFGDSKEMRDPPEELKKLIVRDKIKLLDVVTIKEFLGPIEVYRVNLNPAIRITGEPPEGKSVAAAAARCVNLAEAEMKRLGARGFALENLSAK